MEDNIDDSYGDISLLKSVPFPWGVDQLQLTMERFHGTENALMNLFYNSYWEYPSISIITLEQGYHLHMIFIHYNMFLPFPLV